MALNDAYVIAQRGFLHPPERLFSAFRDPHVGDHFRYLELSRPSAERSGAARARAEQAPWRYRILTPALVRGLTAAGMERNAAFYLVSQVGLVAFLTLLFLLLRARQVEERLAILGVVLAGLVPGAVRWYAFQYWMADPLSLCAITAALLLIQRDRAAWLLVLAPLAALNRENILLVFPFLLVSTWQASGGKRALVRSLPPLVLTLAVLAGLRIAIDGAPSASLATTIVKVLSARLSQPIDQLYFATLGSFGVFSVLPAINGRPRSWRSAVPDLALIAGAFATLLVATNTDRLLAYALPCVAPLGLRSVQRFLGETRVSLVPFCSAVVGLQALVYFRSSLEWTDLQPFDPWIAAALAGFLVLCLLLRQRPASAADSD